MAHPAASSQRTPIELRVVATLLALDLALGVWMRLHAERWLTFFVTQVPVLGVAAAAWGVLPDAPREWFRDRVRAVLGRRWALTTLVATLGALGVASLSCSTVRVESVDPDARTRLRVVPGDRTLEDIARFDAARDAPLNRLTSPVAFRVWLSPFGRRYWVYGRGVATTTGVVFPWVPRVVRYPDDFDSLATVVALPTRSLHAEIVNPKAPVVLVLRDGRDSSSVIATDTLRGMGGVLFAFPEADRPDSVAHDAWRGWLRAYYGPDADTARLASDMNEDVRAWDDVRWRPTRRPVVLHDTLLWELHLPGRPLPQTGKVAVTHAITSIFLTP